MKENRPKKNLWIILLCLGFLFFTANAAQAILLTNTDVDWGGTIASITIEGQSQRWYTEYELYADEFGDYVTAFCVENATADSYYAYELIPVPDYIDQTAVWIADQFFNGGTTWNQDATQLAIWEAMFDDGLNAVTGDFQTTTLVADVQAILALANAADISSISGPISLAHSPPGSSNPTPSQDYLVAQSVPDASLMYLLGPALIGLGLFGRRKNT